MNRQIRLTILSLLSVLIAIMGTACSTFYRSPESGYNSSSHKADSNWKKTSEDTSNVIESRTDRKVELKQLENGLSGKRELEQYSKALPWFNGDDEKIEFLRLRTYEQKQEWLISKDLPSRSKAVTSRMQGVVDAQDIAVGMPEALVKKSWGEPQEIDVSGIPEFRNLRWKYKKFISTPDGYKSERKTVYFEGGRVVGWEVE
jgi:hypothetical protein